MIARRALALVLLLSTVSAVCARGQEPPPRQWVPDRYLVTLIESAVLHAPAVKSAGDAWEGHRERRFDPGAPSVVAYRKQLMERRAGWLADVEQHLQRRLVIHHRLEYLNNAVSVSLSEPEARQLAAMPGVLSVQPVPVMRPQTDAGPAWIGAPAAWAETGSMGEGVIVGVIDSGVNWDHPAFADVTADGFDHVNPRGSQFGLCGNAAVGCNDKLIGVYDFTQEGQRIGRDVDGHGTHVASTAVGNRRTSNVQGNTASLVLDVSGVAPRANLVSYKVCVADNPDTTEDENTCFLDAILDAYDQVVADRVDIVNYSIGGDATDPWLDADTRAMLDARAAGILLVTSAGNGGPAPGTLTSPANAPWMLSVANISHNRRFENVLQSMTGGNAAAPPDLEGAGFTGAYGPAPIVHAADFGNALCGAGNPELQPRCEDHTGASNPFAPGTFDGQIVVCDRGTFGRVEKGFNLRAAGAGGYILANTAAQGETVVSDDHCLPTVHLGSSDGDLLRQWLAAGGDDRSAVISGQSQLLDDAFGDSVSASSSRGPDTVVPQLLKPELSAPGSNILAAGVTGATSDFKSGTSMASPHVAGAAAVLLSANTQLSPSDLHSLLMTTALNSAMTDGADGSLADGFAAGAGRVNVAAAAAGGLVMTVSREQFLAARPAAGGDPASLNLPGLVAADCLQTCQFTRTVTALAGGTWDAAISSRDGLSGTVTPARFELAAGESQSLTVNVVAANPARINLWSYGYVTLTPANASVAEQRLTLQIRTSPGNLPDLISIETTRNHGSRIITLEGLTALPDARFATLGLARARDVVRNLPEDPTRNDPYDNLSADGGAFFENQTVSASGSNLIARTVPGNNGDLDLFVGRDLNGNLRPDSSEELCRSTSPDAAEQCVIENAAAGNYWIMVQNWGAFAPASLDQSVLRLAAVSPDDGGLVATGPGRVPALSPFEHRLIWNRGAMQAGETWMGVLLPQAQPGANIGAVPVELVIADDGSTGSPASPDLTAKSALALASDQSVEVALQPDQGHGRLYIDLPASAQNASFEISAPAGIETRIVRETPRFASPGVPRVASIDSPEVVLSGSGQATIEADAARYYVVPVNTSGSAQALTVSVSVAHDSPSITPVQGLWFNPQRDGAGFNLNRVDGQLIIEWYTYNEDGSPVWYLAQGPFQTEGTTSGDVWQATLNHFSWNGLTAAATPVGVVRLIFQSATDLVFDYQVNGDSGSEPYTAIIADLSCGSNGPVVERTGLWFLPASPGFGYSILSVASQQVHINYLYGPTGLPRWVLGQGEADAESIALSQFSGFCPACATDAVSSLPVGVNEVRYDSPVAGAVTTEVIFAPPLNGQWIESGDWANLTPQPACEN